MPDRIRLQQAHPQWLKRGIHLRLRHLVTYSLEGIDYAYVGYMLMDVEVIVGVSVRHWWIAMLAAAKFRIVELDIGDRLKAIAEIDGDMLRQTDKQACAQLRRKGPVIGFK